MFNQLINSLFETYSFRGGLLVLSGIMLNGAVAGSLMRPNRTNNDKQVDISELQNSESDKEEDRWIEEISNRIEMRNKDSNIKFVTERTNGNGAEFDLEDDKLLAKLPFRNGTNVFDSDKVINSLEELYELSKEASAFYDNKLQFAKLSGDNTNLDLKLREIDHTELVNDSNEPMKLSTNVKDLSLVSKLRNDNNASTISETSRIVEDIEKQHKINLSTQNKLPPEKPDQIQNKVFEWQILKDPKLILMMISQTLLAVAFMIPFTYLPDVIISLGYR